MSLPNEPVYEDVDPTNGDPISNYQMKRPKYCIPDKPLHHRVLNAVGRKYFPHNQPKYDGQYYKGLYTIMERSMLSLDTGRISPYPTEWVDNCIERAIDMRKKNKFIQLKGLTTLILNKQKKEQFIQRYMKKNETSSDSYIDPRAYG